MFCVNCGMQLPDGSKFCPNCGQPVLRADVSATGETPPPPELPKTPSEPLPGAGTDSGDVSTGSLEPKKPSKVIIILGCLVGLALVIAVIFFVTRPHDDEQEKVNVSEFYENADTTENESVDSNQNETAEEVEEIAADDAEQSGELALLPEDTKEGKLQREIMQMNSASYEEQMIDVYEIKRKAGKRDSSYVWNDTVFYTLEGYREHNDYLNKNQCTLVKKELINKESGNIMDYEIYLNPQTNVANKIVSIEYLEDGIEVTEYYYTKNKKPSFVFQYQTDNYVSSYATPDKKGQRFLFNKDCLVTWRKIDQNGTKNFCIGNNEINRLKGQWGKNTLFLYSGLNSDQKKKFDKLEKRMLNAAYNTYETVMNAEGISIIQGYVYDKNMAPLPEATIELYDESFEKLIFCANVKTDGTYRIYVPSEAYEYNIRVIKDGYGDCDIYRVVISNELVGVYQDSIYLFESGLDDKEVSIILGDALNYNEYGTGMVLLSNAKVNVRKGINNRTGSQIVATGITDNSGYISLILPPGVYTLEVMADGYETMYYTIIVNPMADCMYEFYAAPELRDGECAIVLTWGASPSDLDSHLFTASGSGSSHVWYGRMWDDSGNNLDVDDTSSFGPETMTIDSLSATDYYKFCVVDFTDCSNGDLRSYSMSQSQATVNVYTSDGLVGTYHVPTNTPGVIWEVFEIRNGRLTPIQRYYDNVTNKDWWHQDK